MAAKKRGKPETREEQRSRSAAETFEETTDSAWAHLMPTTAEGSPTAARARDDYIPKRFRGAPDSFWSSTGPPGPTLPVPDDVRWAAAHLIEQLEPLAQGRPCPLARGARRPPFKPPPRSIGQLLEVVRGPDHDEYGAGSRMFTPEDAEAVREAYQAWTGLAIEDTWKLVLEEELRAALELRTFLRRTPKPMHMPIPESAIRLPWTRRQGTPSRSSLRLSRRRQ